MHYKANFARTIPFTREGSQVQSLSRPPQNPMFLQIFSSSDLFYSAQIGIQRQN